MVGWYVIVGVVLLRGHLGVSGLKQVSLRVVPQNDGDIFDNPLGLEEDCAVSSARCWTMISEPLEYCHATPPSGSDCLACKCDEATPYYNTTALSCEDADSRKCRSTVGFSFDQELTLPYNTFIVRQILLPDKTFPCDGRVVSWLLRLRNTRVYSLFSLQVWRPNATDTFVLVGSHHIVVEASSKPGYTDSYYRFPTELHIPVKAGDLLGIYAPYGMNDLPFAQGYVNGDASLGTSRAFLYLPNYGVALHVVSTPSSFLQVRNTAAHLVAFIVEESYTCVNVTVDSPRSSSALPQSQSPAPDAGNPTAIVRTTPNPLSAKPDAQASISALSLSMAILVPIIAVLVAIIILTSVSLCWGRRARTVSREQTKRGANVGDVTPGGSIDFMTYNDVTFLRPTDIVAPAAYEVSSITPYATSTQEAPHQYDVISENKNVSVQSYSVTCTHSYSVLYDASAIRVFTHTGGAVEYEGLGTCSATASTSSAVEGSGRSDYEEPSSVVPAAYFEFQPSVQPGCRSHYEEPSPAAVPAPHMQVQPSSGDPVGHSQYEEISSQKPLTIKTVSCTHYEQPSPAVVPAAYLQFQPSAFLGSSSQCKESRGTS